MIASKFLIMCFMCILFLCEYCLKYNCQTIHVLYYPRFPSPWNCLNALWQYAHFCSELYKRTTITRDKLDEYYKLILRDQPQATWPPYNYESLKLILKPAYEQMKGNNKYES